MTEKKSSKPTLILNVLFIVVCASIFLFLWNAPEETTTKLPQDEIHSKFFGIGKKEAEKFCEECHNPDGDAPLPEAHPPKYRCLFCHKRQ